MECQVRERSTRVEWGNVENIRNNLPLSFTGVFRVLKETKLENCERGNQERIPEWKQPWLIWEVTGVRDFRTQGHCQLHSPWWMCLLFSAYWSPSFLSQRDHAFLMSTRFFSSSFLISPPGWYPQNVYFLSGRSPDDDNKLSEASHFI